MQLLQFLKYNNYFNRKHLTIYNKAIDYWNATDTPLDERDLPEQNFNPGDGVTTSHILGKYNESDQYDYLVVYDKNVGIQTVQSRWFILKATRLRGGQYELQLKRDSLSDFESNILDAPAIIERAMVEAENPLVFNKENFTYNQIKKHEYLLKDETKCPWAVAYMPLNIDVSNPIIVDTNITAGAIELQSLPVNAGTYRKPLTMKYFMQWKNGSSDNYFTTLINGTGHSTTTSAATGGSVHTTLETATIVNKDSQGFSIYGMLSGYGLDTLNNGASEYLGTIIDDIVGLDAFDEVYQYRGQTIKVGANYYKVEVTNLGRDDRIISKYLKSGTLLTDLNNTIAASGLFASGHNTMDEETFKIECSTETVVVRYIDITNEYGCTYTLSNTMPNNDSGLYKVITFPVGDIQIYNNGNNDVKCNYNIQRQAAIALGVAYSSLVYDIQLLPYCPVRNLIKNGKIDIKDATNYTYITRSGDNVGILFYVTSCNSSFNIYEVEDESGNTVPINEVLNVEQKESYNVRYPKTATNSINTGDVRELWTSSGLDTITGTIMNQFEYNDWVLVSCPNDGIKVEKVDINSNEILQTYHTDQISIDTEWVGSNTLQITNIDLGTIYTNWNDYKNGNYRIVLTFETTPSFETEEFSIPTGIARAIWRYLVQDVTYVKEDTAISTKVDSECSFERLCSPNYQGNFEFCVAKNGSVNLINVDVTLKPYNPYIHLNPDFGNLYGTDFNDARGLICNGDFSLGQITEAFRSYELQNKNYQAIFDRQIESMDVLHKIDKTEAIVGAITGTLQGGTTGGMVGAMSGIPGGAAAGAMLGTTASLIGGVSDLNNMERRYTEQKDLAIDQHNFQLDNIKALPYSLTKCPALTYNNKIFPFVESYDCTDEEKSALRQYIALRSMNVGVIGTISQYKKESPTFIQGQLIRLDTLHCSTAIANDIYNELKQGVYM